MLVVLHLGQYISIIPHCSIVNSQSFRLKAFDLQLLLANGALSVRAALPFHSMDVAGLIYPCPIFSEDIESHLSLSENALLLSPGSNLQSSWPEKNGKVEHVLCECCFGQMLC